MELRHLRYFVAVAEELHFRRAAERLHVAQPAVSEQIRKLEAELGVLLLNRTQRSVALTEAGAVFLEDARHVLRQAEVAERAARRARDGVLARLRIGYVPDALPSVVPHALHRLRESTPAVDVELEAGGARALLDDVRAERLDAAIVCLPAPLKGLRVHEVGYEEAIVAMASWHRRSVAGEMTLAELADERILVMAREMNPAFYDAVVSAFRSQELSPTLIESTSPVIEHALLEVAAGSGLALLPASVSKRVTIDGIEFRELAGPTPGCPLAIVTRDAVPSTPIQSFLHELARSTHIARRRALRAASTTSAFDPGSSQAERRSAAR
jgi:DNA-binding transcriptional LysR family regulator